MGHKQTRVHQLEQRVKNTVDVGIRGVERGRGKVQGTAGIVPRCVRPNNDDPLDLFPAKRESGGGYQRDQMMERLARGHPGQNFGSVSWYKRPCTMPTVRRILETDEHTGLPSYLVGRQADGARGGQEARAGHAKLTVNRMVEFGGVLRADTCKRDKRQRENHAAHIAPNLPASAAQAYGEDRKIEETA